MRAKHWLIGCTLCIVGIGSAAATSLDAQDLDNSTRTSSDSSGQRDDVNSGCGDLLASAHYCPSRRAGSDNSGNTPNNSPDRSGGANSAPARTRQPHLGWQSLLPGSIQ